MAAIRVRPSRAPTGSARSLVIMAAWGATDRRGPSAAATAYTARSQCVPLVAIVAKPGPSLPHRIALSERRADAARCAASNRTDSRRARIDAWSGGPGSVGFDLVPAQVCQVCPGLLRLWPQLPYIGRHHMLDVLDLSGADPLRQQREDCLRNALDRDKVINALIASQLQLDAGQELLFLTYAQRLARRIPPFVVEATDEHRELRAKLRHLLH